MSQQRAKQPLDERLPANGKVEFEDGDWVQFPTEPTHGQSKTVAKAIFAVASGDTVSGAMDCMAPTISTLAIAGKLTSETSKEAIPFPFTVESLDEIAAGKMNRLFALALTIQNLIPNPPRPK